MNNNAQTLGISIIVAITLFIVGMICLNFIRSSIDDVRLDGALNCSGTDSISDGTKLTCLAVDLVMPYFIILVLSISGGAILARLILWKINKK